MKGGVRGTLLGLLLLVASAPAAELQWRLAREEGGVRVYLAEVPGSRYQAYRGVVVLRTDMPTLLALQEDVAASCAWIYACSEQRLLGSEGALSWIYSRYVAPWPVTPRDSVLQVATEIGADGSVTRRLTAAPTRLPEQRGHVRVRKLEGIWRLRPLGEGRVEVVYQAHTEPGGSVPSWLANSFVVDAPLQTLKALKALVEGVERE
jgi:hypothetical protein